MMCIVVYLDYFLLSNNHAEKVMICLAYVPWQALLHAYLHGRPKARMELGLLLEHGPGASNADLAAADMSKVLQVKITAEQAEMASLVDKPFTNKPFGLFSGEFARRHGFHLLGTTSTWLLDAVLLLSRHLLAAFLSSSLTTAAVEAVQARKVAGSMGLRIQLAHTNTNGPSVCSCSATAVSRSQLETSMPRRWMDCGWALGASSLESAAVVAATRSGSNVDARMLRRNEGGRRGRKKNKGLE
uniref:Uncharacterized protein n=1 Tax=Oryza nivara TaxID=4536 RepID=A0A0E0IQV8_ORYNI